MNLRLLLMVIAIVLLAVATLIGFDIIQAKHIFGWLGAGLFVWAVADTTTAGPWTNG